MTAMEFNFRPQWRPWFFQMRQIPACSRCGNQHRQPICFAASKQCFKCHRIGHYARMCAFRPNKNIPECKIQSKPKSKSQKERDSRRMKDYLEAKSMTRSLPFANLRDSALISCLDSTRVIKNELNCVKRKLSTQQFKNVTQADEIKNLREQLVRFKGVTVENDILRADILRLQENQKQQSVIEDNCRNKVKRIKELELDIQGNMYLLNDLQRKFDECATEKRQLIKENSILHYKIDEYSKRVEGLKGEILRTDREKEQLQSTLNQMTMYQNQNTNYNLQFGYYQ